MWIDGADFRFSDDRPKGGAANQHVSFYPKRPCGGKDRRVEKRQRAAL